MAGPCAKLFGIEVHSKFHPELYLDCSFVLKDVASCAPCMAKWIVKSSDKAMAAPHLLAPVSARTSASSIGGWTVAMTDAKVPPDVADVLFSDVVRLGATDVTELVLHDWEQLPSWHKLRPLEVRRLRGVLKL